MRVRLPAVCTLTRISPQGQNRSDVELNASSTRPRNTPVVDPPGVQIQFAQADAKQAPTCLGELARELPIQPPYGGLALGVVALQLFVLWPPDRGDRLIFGGAA